MRTLLKITIPTEPGNRALNDGSFVKIMEEAIAKLKPEAAYFLLDKGCRCAMLVVDLKNASDIPGICEPMFMGFNGEIEIQPAMNLEELKKGLGAVAR